MALTKAHNRMIEGAAVNVKDFGAVGDGVTDDTAQAQSFLNYLSSNGGKGIIDCPLRVSTLSITSNTKPFVIEWFGDNCTLSANTKATPLTFDTCNNITLIRPRVDGRASQQNATTTADTYHGIKIQDCTDTYVYQSYIENYNGSAILILKNITAPLRNFVIDGFADAGGVGDDRNGFVIVDANECELINCVVTGAVSFGLELKNDCERCAIRGGSVTNSGAAVYSGQQGATAPGVGGVADSVIEGVTAYNVDQGYAGGYTRNVHVDIAVLDQTIIPGYLGADFGCRFINSEDSSVRIREFKGDVEVAQFFTSSKRCNAIIDNMESESSRFVDYQSGCNNNHVEIKRASKNVGGTYSEYDYLRDKVSDLGTSNSFIYEGGFRRLKSQSAIRYASSTAVTIDGATSSSTQDIINPIFTMGANEFLQEGDELVIDISGQFTGTGANKRLFLTFGGSSAAFVVSGITTTQFFNCRMIVSSRGSASQVSSVELIINGQSADIESQTTTISTSGSFDVILKGRLDAGSGNTIVVNRCIATLIQSGT